MFFFQRRGHFVCTISLLFPDDVKLLWYFFLKLSIAFPDFKKRRFTENRIAEECEASGLDALATAAVLGDNVEDSGEPSVGVTTRHPRHRPGCTCIVCIQPPSGKGKHKPTCICNVCMTVKRRFKTLMLRKKKRQEREAEIKREKGQIPLKDESELEGTSENALLQAENERGKNEILMEVAGSSKGHLDLNCDPNREEEMLLAEATGMSMSTLVHAPRRPMEEMYTRPNGDPNCLLYKTVGGSEGPPPDEGFLASSIDIDVEQDKEDGNEE